MCGGRGEGGENLRVGGWDGVLDGLSDTGMRNHRVLGLIKTALCE